MRFLLLICHDSSFTERTVKGDSAAWFEEMKGEVFAAWGSSPTCRRGEDREHARWKAGGA